MSKSHTATAPATDTAPQAPAPQATTSTTITRYGLTVDCAALPVASQVALMERGIAHVFGNEVASKVASAKEKFKTANGTDMPEAEVSALTDQFRQDALNRLQSGVLGGGSRGPRATPIESIIRQIAEAEIIATLRGNGLSMPSGKNTVRIGEAEYTRADLISRRVAMPQHAERLRKEAEAEVRRRAKATAVAEGASLADQL